MSYDGEYWTARIGRWKTSRRFRKGHNKRHSLSVRHIVNDKEYIIEDNNYSTDDL